MAKKLWGGRFEKKTDPYFEKFSSSILTDYRLAKCDLVGSFLHIYILKGAGFISNAEFSKLKKGILSLLSKVEKETFPYDFSSEDIHTNVQNALAKKTGAVASKLQTCRSRNDQVVFDTILYCLISGARLQEFIFHVRKSFLELGGLYSSLVIPGFTHLQHAQPVYFKDYLKAYSLMFERDAQRLEDCLLRLGISLGSGALAGTPIPASIYRTEIKKALKGLKMPGLIKLVTSSENSLFTVSDRDFIAELLSVLAMMGMHISRLSEDFILWSTKEFGFLEVGDEYCTGSSLMPQKKNPDALELMRGYTGTLYGNLISVLTMMKGLPLSYNRDMQLDKEPLFSSLEIIEDELVILCGLLKSIKVNKENIRQQLKDESLCATDLADYLVSRGVAFQEAHESIGALIQYSLETGKEIKKMSQEELNQFSKKLDRKEVLKRLDPFYCASLKKSVSRG